MMNVRYASGQRVVDRDHGEIGLARLNGGERLLEGVAGHGFEFWKSLAAGQIGIGAVRALKGNFLVLVFAGRH